MTRERGFIYLSVESLLKLQGLLMIRAFTTDFFISTRYSFRNFTRSIHHQNLSDRLTMSVKQPPWSSPSKATEEPVLRVYNSLTKTKVKHIDIMSFKGISRIW